MIESVVIVSGIGVLSFLSGMLGLGVAFAAIPFLGIFMKDLVHEIQPLSLLLNGITALLSAIGFARSGFVEWKRAVPLAIITTLFAPSGAYIVQFVEQKYVWIVYFIAVLYLAYRLFKPVKYRQKAENFKLGALLAIPISVLSGFLGVGPGFLLMPTLILVGFEPKKAAGINAFAVCPPSFSSLIPHLTTARWNLSLTLTLCIMGGIFSFLGARVTSAYVPGNRIRQMFGILILVVTAYKVWTLI
jgi:uncharacterized membrane protein YfcA